MSCASTRDPRAAVVPRRWRPAFRSGPLDRRFQGEAAVLRHPLRVGSARGRRVHPHAAANLPVRRQNSCRVPGNTRGSCPFDDHRGRASARPGHPAKNHGQGQPDRRDRQIRTFPASAPVNAGAGIARSCALKDRDQAGRRQRPSGGSQSDNRLHAQLRIRRSCLGDESRQRVRDVNSAGGRQSEKRRRGGNDGLPGARGQTPGGRTRRRDRKTRPRRKKTRRARRPKCVFRPKSRATSTSWLRAKGRWRCSKPSSRRNRRSMPTSIRS